MFINTDETKTLKSSRNTIEWAREVVRRGAGEIVLNCMNNDGVQEGYDIEQIKAVKKAVSVPLVASGGAGNYAHFFELFKETSAEAALAASVFHSNKIPIPKLKSFLKARYMKCEKRDV